MKIIGKPKIFCFTSLGLLSGLLLMAAAYRFTEQPSEQAFSQPIQSGSAPVIGQMPSSPLRLAPTQVSALDFPLAWYDRIQDPRTPALAAQEGMNLVIPYVGESNTATILAYLNAADKAGIKVLLEVRRSAVKVEDLRAIRAYIRTFKNHPAVIGWYLFDEPELPKNNVSAQSMLRSYQTIKQEDPKRPIAAAFIRQQMIPAYLPAVDIPISFRYPINNGFAEFQGLQDGKFLNSLQRISQMSGGKRFWFALQAYGERNNQGQVIFNGRKQLPTATEQRYMAYSTILQGADGLLFWARYRSVNSWMSNTLIPLVKEIREELPSFSAGSIPGGVRVGDNRSNLGRFSDSSIEAEVFPTRVPNQFLLVVINHDIGNRNVMLDLSPLNVSLTQAIPQGQRTTTSPAAKPLPLSSRRFSDSLGSYGVKVYELK